MGVQEEMEVGVQGDVHGVGVRGDSKMAMAMRTKLFLRHKFYEVVTASGLGHTCAQKDHVCVIKVR